jgi:hypothetical protein
MNAKGRPIIIYWFNNTKLLKGMKNRWLKK